MADDSLNLDSLSPIIELSGVPDDEQVDGGEAARKRKRREICRKSREFIKRDKQSLIFNIKKLSGKVNELKEEDERLHLEGGKLGLKFHDLKNKKEQLEGQSGNMKEIIAELKEKKDKSLKLLEEQQLESKILELAHLKHECRVLDPNANWLHLESEMLLLKIKISEEENKNRSLKAHRNSLYAMRG